MLATTGTMHARRIQGGILADGACSHLDILQVCGTCHDHW